MNLELFFSKYIDENHIILSNDEYKHCVKVKRHTISDKLYVIDGSGKLYQGIITEINRNEVILQVISTSEVAPNASKKMVCIAPTKNLARLEWFFEKSVEIGIDEIGIVFTERTERFGIKPERIEKIIISAMKQSLNITMPSVIIHNCFHDLLVYYADVPQKFIAYGHENAPQFLEMLREDLNSLVVIGPEGDFTTREIQSAKEQGYKICSLGNSRLRTETAGVVAITLMNQVSALKNPAFALKRTTIPNN